jgi:uncharacterized protein (TIGR00255 family)
MIPETWPREYRGGNCRTGKIYRGRAETDALLFMSRPAQYKAKATCRRDTGGRRFEEMALSVSSMTGFARVEDQLDGLHWIWELKSVNGKSLDLRFRLPGGWDVLEAPCKAALGEVAKRGSISAVLTVTEREAPAGLRINETVLTQVISLIQSLEGRLDAAPPRLDGLLAIRGVLETGGEEETEDLRAARIAAVTTSFARAVTALGEARRAEGARLHQVLEARLSEIAGLVGEAETAAQRQPAEIRARFARQVAALFESVPPLPEERLAQELALMIARADIREELDRLAAHLTAARDLLTERAQIGRRFDFLCQEFNREANTLCSKSADIGLTRVGLALKAAIEQLREQVQNIE